MRAKKKFPISVKCSACDGRGHVSEERDVIPCKFCGHDVYYEHRVDEGWTSTPGHGWDKYAICDVDECKCTVKLEHSGRNPYEGWAHP